MKTANHANLLFRLPVAAAFLVFSVTAYSQETGKCAENLKSAQSFFAKGQVEQVPSLLKDCLKSGFKKEEALSAYKLLIQTYLLNDNIVMSDSTMYAFLKKNPEYQTSPTDHSSFVYLFNSYDVKPVVKLGIHVGTNVPFLTFVVPHSVMGEPGVSSYSRKAINLFFSLEARFEISKKLEWGFEMGYSQLGFTNSRVITDQGLTVYTETQNRLEIPVSACYNFKGFGKFTPYARLGMGGAYNFGTSAVTTYTSSDRNNSDNRTGESLDRKDSRFPVDLFGQIGGGMKFKISHAFFFAELRSNFGILNQVVSGGENTELLIHRYNFTDDDFRLNSLNLSLGYTYIFYKPSKRKE